MPHIIAALQLQNYAPFETFTFENSAQPMSRRIMETVHHNDSLYITEGDGLAWVVRVVLQKAIPGVFVLLMTRRKPFLETQIHFRGSADSLIFDDLEQKKN